MSRRLLLSTPCNAASRARPWFGQISDTSKIKKMSKKQLRNIKKADTSGVKPKILSK
jgi:hypothetical protein